VLRIIVCRIIEGESLQAIIIRIDGTMSYLTRSSGLFVAAPKDRSPSSIRPRVDFLNSVDFFSYKQR